MFVNLVDMPIEREKVMEYIGDDFYRRYVYGGRSEEQILEILDEMEVGEQDEDSGKVEIGVFENEGPGESSSGFNEKLSRTGFH